MKRFCFLALLLLCAFGVIAQSKYEIYKVSGDVLFKTRFGNQWSKAIVHQELGITDSLSIPKGGKVSILRLDTKELFNSVSVGNMKMYDIVRAAREQSEKTIKLANAEFRDNMSSQGKTQSYNMVGATSRGNEGDGIEDSIVSMIHSLANSALNDLKPRSHELIAKATTIDGETFFTIQNLSSQVVYVNILCVDKSTKRARLLYTDLDNEEPYIMIPSGQTVVLDQKHFVDIASFVLVPFGTVDAYDTNIIVSDVTYLDITSSEKPLYTNYIVAP